MRELSHKTVDLAPSGSITIWSIRYYWILFVFISFSKWLVTSVTLMALVLSSVAYSYPMKMEGMMNMRMNVVQDSGSMNDMSDCMPECDSTQSNSSENNENSYIQCDMSSMSMNNSHHCSDKGDSCCKTICVVSVYALPIGLTAYTNAMTSVITYAQYNEQKRSFTSSSLYRPPIT